MLVIHQFTALAVAVPDGAVEGHDDGDHPVDFLGGLLLVGLDVFLRGLGGR